MKRIVLSITLLVFFFSLFSSPTQALSAALPAHLFDTVQTGPIYTVNTSADHNDGLCSTDDCTLREAINAANAHPNASTSSPDKIHFNIASGCDATSGVCTIAPTTALPQITDAVEIDGYSQPGADANTLLLGDNARLLIELNGANTPAGTDGLVSSGSGGCTIRGLVINRFPGHGLTFTNNLAVSNLVAGNYIGTNATGSAALGNAGDGIYIHAGTLVGGTTPDARNVISGNGQDGIYGSGQVLGNYIGTDASGTISLGNQGNGLAIEFGAIGDWVPGAVNLISGNGQAGIYINDSKMIGGTMIEGNFIGTDATGTFALGNETGIKIDRGSSITIGSNIAVGSSTNAARNLISGNRANGIVINKDTIYISVSGNFIGTDVTGRMALGNSGNGVVINSATSVKIGWLVPESGNLISGNGGSGILISGSYTPGSCTIWDGLYEPGTCNKVQGNFIGTDMTGTASLGNGAYGIDIVGSMAQGATNTLIGGTQPEASNRIAGNGLGGVHIQSTSGTAISVTVLGNAIFANSGLGIDLAEIGVTPNDDGDGDTGPNNRQNFPVLTGLSGGYLNGTLNSLPNATFRVELFVNTTCDPSSYGEGEQFLGAVDTVTTDASGNAAFSFAYTPVQGKHYLTATATNAATGDTSEFSACFDSTPPVNTTTSLSASASSAAYGDRVTFTARVSAVQDGVTPTGQVQFKEGNTPLGSPVTLDGQGQAKYITSTLPIGNHTLTAEFIANAAFNGSSGSASVTIRQPYSFIYIPILIK